MFYYFQSSSLQFLSATVRVEGPDAYTYLQGQCSQDINRPPGAIAYGLWLDQKGKVAADSFVLRLGDSEFQLFSPAIPGPALRARLESCLVADEVSIVDESDAWTSVGLWGEGVGLAVARIAGRRPAPGAWLEGEDVRVFAGRLSVVENYEVLLPRARVGEVVKELAAAGGQEVDMEVAERERILSGLPAVPADVGPHDLPNEAGLNEVAVSYTKGCYLGQEVMARLKNLGQVRRRLHVVGGKGISPRAGAALYQNGRKIGECRSSAPDGGGFVAMAMLSLLHLQPAGGLALTPDGEASIRILRRV